MSSDQIAEATLQAMNIQTIAILAQTFLGMAAIFLGFREVRKWRTEILGGKKIELVLRLGKATLALQTAFMILFYMQDQNKPKEMIDLQLKDLSEMIVELEAASWEAKIILLSKEDEPIRTALTGLKIAIMESYTFVKNKSDNDPKTSEQEKLRSEVSLRIKNLLAHITPYVQ